MKGVVDIIAVVIVACIVVSIGLMLWVFLSNYYSQVSQAGGAATTKSLGTMSSCMSIEEASQNNFFIRNCGTGLITNDTLNVYIDDSPFSFSLNPASIDGGKTGTLSLQGVWSLPLGQHSLRITNPNFETSANFKAEPADSCVMDLEFDEGSGTTAHDYSENGNDGTLYSGAAVCSNPPTAGCPTWTTGKYGSALSFDGINDYVQIPDSSSLNITNVVTVTAWVKLNTVTPAQQRVFNRLDYSNVNGFSLEFDNDRLVFWVYLDEGIGWQQAYIPNSLQNVWYYIVGTYDGKTIRVFRNSIEGTPYSYSDTIGIPSSPITRIGYNQYTPGNGLNGTIDSVRVFNKALTPDQTLNFRLI